VPAQGLEVYVNGVRQAEGEDYVREGTRLLFARPLRREGDIGLWRWTRMFLGIAGTYRQNDTVDVIYETNGKKTVLTGLPIAPLAQGSEEEET
jgi:hypothetical protein